MALSSIDIDGWRANGRGPYVALPVNSRNPENPFWYVAGADGRTNILSGEEGATLTVEVVARALAERWNGASRP